MANISPEEGAPLIQDELIGEVTKRFQGPLGSRSHIEEFRVFRDCAQGPGTRFAACIPCCCRKGLSTKKVEEALITLGLTQKLEMDSFEEFVKECDVNDDGEIDFIEFVGIVNYFIVKEVKLFICIAKAMITDLRRKIVGPSNSTDRPSAKPTNLSENIPDLQEHLRGLSIARVVKALEALWGTVTPEACLRWFEAMDSPSTHKDRLQLLHCLLLTVPFRDSDGRWREFEVGDKALISFGKLNGDIMRQDDVVALEHSSVRFPLKEDDVGMSGLDTRTFCCPSKRPRRMSVDFRKARNALSWAENYVLGNQEERYLAAYTTVDLFSLRRLPYMVHAIESSSVESKVFETPIVSALLSHAWQKVQWFFYTGVICDVVVICLLSGIALDEREMLVPTKRTMAAIALLSFINFLSGWVEFLERIMGDASEGCSGAIAFAIRGVLGSFWSVYEMVVSTWFIIIMIMAMRYKWDDLFEGQDSRWLHDHAIWVEGLLFMKVTHVIIQLMCIRVLGQRVVPAYHALTHLSSRALLFFLFLMFGNAVLTFHAVPIDIYNPDAEDRRPWDALQNLFDIIVLQFRSAILADFSPDELEGEEQRLRLQPLSDPLRPPNNTLKGKIVGPSMHGPYHHGLQTTNVLFIILIHILLLNVYIGVLSEQYSRIVEKEREHFEKFRAIFTRKMLLRYHCCLRCRQRWQGEPKGPKRTWIAYKQAIFKDPFEAGTREDRWTQTEGLTMAQRMPTGDPRWAC